MRQSGGKLSRNNGWWYWFDDAPRITPPVTPRRKAPVERAADERVANAYDTLLAKYLTLSDNHRLALRRRGLTDTVINTNGYRSVPDADDADGFARLLARDHDLTGIPGFYKEHGAWRMVTPGAGFFVPSRSAYGEVRGMQIRRDAGADPRYIWFSSKDRDGGASSGSWAHFAGSEWLRGSGEVWLTEGLLKADIAAHFLGAPVIGAPGVSSFGTNQTAAIILFLNSYFPSIKTMNLAFDMDWEHNEHVRASLFRLADALEVARFRVRIRTWAAEFKGVDDLLFAVAEGRA